MKLVLLLCVLGAVAGPARADVHTHAGARVSIEIPSDWEVKTTEKIVAAVSQDKAVGLMFWVVERKDAAASVKLLEKMLGPIIKEPKWDPPQQADHHGMKGLIISGTAKIKNKPVFVMTAILAPTPSDKGILIYAGVDQAKADAYKGQLRAMFDSLKPAR